MILKATFFHLNFTHRQTISTGTNTNSTWKRVKEPIRQFHPHMNFPSPGECGPGNLFSVPLPHHNHTEWFFEQPLGALFRDSSILLVASSTTHQQVLGFNLCEWNFPNILEMGLWRSSLIDCKGRFLWRKWHSQFRCNPSNDSSWECKGLCRIDCNWRLDPK